MRQATRGGFMMSPPLALTLLCGLLSALGCESPRPRGDASLTLSVEVTPPLLSEGPLALWEAPPSGPLPLRGSQQGEAQGEAQSEAQGGLWSRRGELLHLTGEPFTYQSEGLFRTLTAVELPAEELSIVGLDGAWLHSKLSDVELERALAPEPVPLLLPLAGLDYRSAELPLTGSRRAQRSLSPWSALPWLMSATWQADDPVTRSLEPLITSLSPHRSAWSSLAERLGLESAWSLLGLLIQLQVSGEEEASQAVARELAISALVSPEPLSAEARTWLRALPCVLDRLDDPDALAQVYEQAERGLLDVSCALPIELVWVKATLASPHGSLGGDARVELSAESFDGRPLSLKIERLSAVTPPSPWSALSPEELSELTPHRVAPVDRCEGRGATLSCPLDWRDAEGDTLTLLASVSSEDGRVTLGGRVLRYPLPSVPAWKLDIALLSRPRVVNSALSTWRPAQLLWSPRRPSEATSEPERPEVLPLSGAGLAELPHLGRPSPLTIELDLLTPLGESEELRLWSPFPSPGRWRPLQPSEQLRLSVGGAPLFTDDTLISAPPLPDVTLLLSPLSAREDQALSDEVLTHLGGAPSSLTSPSLTARLEALSRSPERLAELIGTPAQATSLGWSQAEVAHLRAWLCVETATQVTPNEPPTRSAEGGELSATWLEWMSTGCLIGALSVDQPERAELFEDLSAPEALESLVTRQLWGPERPQGAWLERLLGRAFGRHDDGALRVSLSRRSSPEGRLELLTTLDQPSSTLTTSLTGEEHLLSIEAITGLRSLSLQYLEAPWLIDPPQGSAPSPYLSARLLTGAELSSITPERPSASCLSRRAPLSALQGAWRLDPSWRERHPLSDPRWFLSYDGVAREASDDPCHVAVLFDASSLPEGAYAVELELEQTWGPRETRVARFTIDRAPLTAQAEALGALQLLDQVQVDTDDPLTTHHHAQLLLADPSEALEVGEARPFSLISLNRSARCALVMAPSLSVLPPRAPARFTGEAPFSSLTLSAVDSMGEPSAEPSTRWALLGVPSAEGSQRLALSCDDGRGERANLTLDLTLDVSPPLLRALWLTQADETALTARRVYNTGSPPPVLSWLLYTDDLVDPLAELIPEQSYDLRGEEGEPSQRVIERWRGWWGAPQCADEPPSRCLLADEGPCVDEVLARCRARLYPLTLHALLEDPQWEPEALSLSLLATRSAPNEAPRSHSSWDQELETLGAFSYLKLPLSAPWTEAGWAPPAEDGRTTLSLQAKALSPAHSITRDRLPMPSLSLRSITPPPLLSFERVWRPTPQLQELSALTQTELTLAQVSNPHPDPIWLQIEAPLTSLQAEGLLDRVSSADPLSASLALEVRESCLWDPTGAVPIDHKIIHSSSPLTAEQLRTEPCSPLPVPREERFSWRAELEWVVEGHDASDDAEGWLRLATGERLTIKLQARWALPPLLAGTLLELGSLPPPRHQHYVLPHTFSGVFWGDSPCLACTPAPMFGRPYRRLNALSLTVDEPLSAEELTWRLQVSPAPDQALEEVHSRLSLGELPAELWYEVSEP